MNVVGLFFSNRSVVLVFLPIIIGGFVVCNSLWPMHTTQGLLKFGLLGNIEDVLYPIHHIAPLLVFANGILINNIFNRNDFMERNNFMPSLIYVVLMSYFDDFYLLSGAIIAQSILILVVYHLLKLRQNEDGRRHVFNASFLFGVACTLYPVLMLGLPFLFWMIWVIRPFVFRESLLTIVGFIIPLVYSGVYSFVFEIKNGLEDFSSFYTRDFYSELFVLGGGVFLLVLLSLGTLLNKLRVSSIRLKKLFRILFLLGVYMVGLTLLEYLVFKKTSSFSLLIFPLMFLLPYSFGMKDQRAFPTFLLYVLIIASVSKFFIPIDSFTF